MKRTGCQSLLSKKCNLNLSQAFTNLAPMYKSLRNLSTGATTTNTGIDRGGHQDGNRIRIVSMYIFAILHRSKLIVMRGDGYGATPTQL